MKKKLKHEETKKQKKIKMLKVISTILTAIWFIVLIISIIAKSCFKAPGLDPVDYALSKSMYNVFIIMAIMGMLSSLLMTISLEKFKKLGNSSHNCINCKKALLVSVTLANLLFYIFFALTFCLRSDTVLIVIVLWVISITISVCMLIALLRSRA